MAYVISCCHRGCFASIALDPKTYEQFRRTGESFYCASGHKQHFTGKTDEQKQIDQLTRELREIDRDYGVVSDQRETLIALVRRCPICAATPGRHVRIYRDPWRFDDDLANVRDWMTEHLRVEHGAALRETATTRGGEDGD